MTSRTEAVRQETRLSKGRTVSSKRPDSSCCISVTTAWKRRPFLSISTMSPGPMPLEVVRARDGAVGSIASSVDWMSAMSTQKLCGGSDGLPDAAVQVEVLQTIGADADDRRAVGSQRSL